MLTRTPSTSLFALLTLALLLLGLAGLSTPAIARGETCPAGLDDIYGDATLCLDPSAPVPAGPTKFSATVFIRDAYTWVSGATRESPQATLYYEDGEVGSPERTGNQWIRVDVPIQGNVLTEIHRSGDFNVKWRHWQGDCSYDDMALTAFPQLYTPGGVGSPLGSDVTLLDGTLIPAVRLRQFNIAGGVELIVDRVTGQPIRASYTDSEIYDNARDILRQIDFTGAFDGSGVFDTNDVFRPAAWFVDGGSGSICPDIDPTCYRADVVYLIDGSGSMSAGSNWVYEIKAVMDSWAPDLDPWYTGIRTGYQVFRTKAFNESDKASDPGCCVADAFESYGVGDNWDEHQFYGDEGLNSLDSVTYRFNVGDTTRGGLVDGLRASFALLKDGRNPLFTRKIVVALFDSPGSTPCTTPEELTLEDMDAGAPYTDYLGDGTNCTAKHDAYVTALYDREFSTDTGFSPDVYAIGVGLAESLEPTIDLVARKGVNASTADVESYKHLVRFFELNGLHFEEVGELMQEEFSERTYCEDDGGLHYACTCMSSGQFCCSQTQLDQLCCSPVPEPSATLLGVAAVSTLVLVYSRRRRS